MTRMIFVNLPVVDLQRAQQFYEALGFTRNPQFSDDTAACMVWSDAIAVMILTHAKWQTFTTRPISHPGSSEVALCLTVASRDDVDVLVEAGAGAGGTIDVNPPADHEFMVTRSVLDLDGHVWEVTWMDPQVLAGNAPEHAGAEG